jgi:Zn-dependent metalloprotease
LTTKIDDQYLFEPATGARLFYLTLTEQLTPRATFSDSRDGLLATAGTLFRDDLSRLRNVTKAITQAFQSVGIS